MPTCCDRESLVDLRSLLCNSSYNRQPTKRGRRGHLIMLAFERPRAAAAIRRGGKRVWRGERTPGTLYYGGGRGQTPRYTGFRVAEGGRGQPSCTGRGKKGGLFPLPPVANAYLTPGTCSLLLIGSKHRNPRHRVVLNVAGDEGGTEFDGG